MARKKISKVIMVYHGRESHRFDKRLDCISCIDAEMEFLRTIREAGGLTPWVETLKEDLSKVLNPKTAAALRMQSGIREAVETVLE